MWHFFCSQSCVFKDENRNCFMLLSKNKSIWQMFSKNIFRDRKCDERE